MKIIGQTHQKIWGRAAVINFTLGSSAAFFYVTAVVSGWGSASFDEGQAALLYTGIAVVLISVGFLLLALESGNTFKSVYSLSNLRSSWMSREVLLAGAFFVFAIAGLINPLSWLQILAAVAAFLFMVSQAFIIFKARAILAWNAAPTPVLMLLSGTTGGLGIFLVFHPGAALEPVVLGAAIGILGLTFAVWVFYIFLLGRSSLEWRHATAYLRTVPSLTLAVGVGVLLPVALIAFAVPYHDLPIARAALAVAGTAMLLGAYQRNGCIILKAGYFRSMRLR